MHFSYLQTCVIWTGICKAVIGLEALLAFSSKRATRICTCWTPEVELVFGNPPPDLFSESCCPGFWFSCSCLRPFISTERKNTDAKVCWRRTFEIVHVRFNQDEKNSKIFLNLEPKQFRDISTTHLAHIHKTFTVNHWSEPGFLKEPRHFKMLGKYRKAPNLLDLFKNKHSILPSCNLMPYHWLCNAATTDKTSNFTKDGIRFERLTDVSVETGTEKQN